MSLLLYQLEGCPYCERVAERLDDLGIPWESRWTAALHSERDEVRRVSGQRLVPVLVDEDRGVIMSESENILEYVETTLVPTTTTA